MLPLKSLSRVSSDPSTEKSVKNFILDEDLLLLLYGIYKDTLSQALLTHVQRVACRSLEEILSLARVRIKEGDILHQDNGKVTKAFFLALRADRMSAEEFQGMIRQAPRMETESGDRSWEGYCTKHAVWSNIHKTRLEEMARKSGPLAPFAESEVRWMKFCSFHRKMQKIKNSLDKTLRSTQANLRKLALFPMSTEYNFVATFFGKAFGEVSKVGECFLNTTVGLSLSEKAYDKERLKSLMQNMNTFGALFGDEGVGTTMFNVAFDYITHQTYPGAEFEFDQYNPDILIDKTPIPSRALSLPLRNSELEKKSNDPSEQNFNVLSTPKFNVDPLLDQLIRPLRYQLDPRVQRWSDLTWDNFENLMSGPRFDDGYQELSRFEKIAAWVQHMALFFLFLNLQEKELALYAISYDGSQEGQKRWMLPHGKLVVGQSQFSFAGEFTADEDRIIFHNYAYLDHKSRKDLALKLQHFKPKDSFHTSLGPSERSWGEFKLEHAADLKMGPCLKIEHMAMGVSFFVGHKIHP